MNSQEGDGEGSAASHGRPCHGCRKRKVRCDKVRPCSNCVRSKQLCTYESSDGIGGIVGTARDSGGASPSTDGELRERLARLEKLMESMLVGEKATTGLGTGSPEVTTNQSLTGSAAVTAGRSNSTPTSTHHQTPQYPSNISSSFPTDGPPTSSPSGSIAPVGQIIFQDGYSAYFDSDFWPGLITEVEDLRRLLDESNSESSIASQWASMATLGMSSPFSATDLSLAHPTLDESNLLCKYFFECVNPFIRALHSSLFARELGMYRRGTFHLPQEFEALLFSVYTLTVNSLRSELVERVFSTSKDELLSRLQVSTQVALTKIHYYKTEKVHGLGALIHYVTFLFQQNLYKDATPLLAITARLAQSMGIHRDSRHFPFSPWVVEIRARLWNQICCLDAQAITSYGAESCLPATADALPPRNTNDRDWHASRFANPSSVPLNAPGFKEMTFALVHREISDTTRTLAKIDGSDLDKRHNIIRQTETTLTQNYLAGIDRSNPSQTVIAALVEMKLSTLRLSVRHRQTEDAKAHPSDPQRHQVFLAAIELLEAIEYHCTTFSALNWEWVFSTTVPWLATAIALTDSRHATRQSDKDRARRQIDNIFARFSHPAPVSNTPLWKVLVQLRQHMQDEGSQTQVLANNSLSGGVGGLGGFNDDLMLDFGVTAGGGGSDPLGYNDPLMIQDLQSFPWYAWTDGTERTSQ